jgi:hypothetical protein
MIVVISIFVLLASVLAVRYFLTKTTRDRLEIEMKIQRTKSEIVKITPHFDSEKKGL